MKLLVIGSGGREHALAWRLAQSGTGRIARCVQPEEHDDQSHVLGQTRRHTARRQIGKVRYRKVLPVA